MSRTVVLETWCVVRGGRSWCSDVVAALATNGMDITALKHEHPSADDLSAVATTVLLNSPVPAIVKRVVFTNGCFDVALHVGHAQFLRRCRELGGKLIVGLNTDESIRRLKGPTRPICTLAERLEVLLACRYVDEVIAFDESTPCELIRRLRPDIIVKGPGYSPENMPEAAVVKGYGGRVVILDGPPVSTTEIMERIRQRA